MPTPSPAALVLAELVLRARRGFPLLPVWGIEGGHCACPAGDRCKQGPGKHPLGKLVPHGVDDATTDEAVLERWLTAYPEANWAVATGHALPEGGFLVAVDVDPRNRGDESLGKLEREHGALPPTVRAISGGNGEHRLFRAASALGGGVLAEGIDFKGLGGYILVAPSLHLSGRRYQWDVGGHPDDTPIAPLPSWAERALADRGRGRPEHTGRDAADSLLGEAFKLAGMLRELLTDGRRAVVCPWAGEHTDERGRGEDSSTVLLPPTLESHFGGFKCLHGHCQHRGWKDVLAALPGAAVAQARLKYRPKPVTQADPSSPAPVENVLADVQSRVEYAKGKVKKSLDNLVTILTHDPRWKGKLSFDEFSEQVLVKDPPWHEDVAPASPSPEWTDEDDIRLVAWLNRLWGLDAGRLDTEAAVRVVARRHSTHPVRAYLRSLTWDGTPRLDRLFVDYFGGPDDPYTRGVGSRWAISAVARVEKPGCQADCSPVLEGSQGIGKSSGLRALIGDEWFFDSSIVIGDKDSYQALRGKWLCELAELDSYRRSDMQRVKAFLSAQSDHYRPSFGRRARTFLRQCVFAGTTNEREYVADSTGARRLWPVRCRRVDVPKIRRDRDQLWAEAFARYQKGEAWYVDTPEFADLCAVEQEDRYQADPWETAIASWLAHPNTPTLNGVTTYDVLTGALAIDTGKVTRSDEMRAATCLRRVGWDRVVRPRTGSTDRARRYFKREPEDTLTQVHGGQGADCTLVQPTRLDQERLDHQVGPENAIKNSQVTQAVQPVQPNPSRACARDEVFAAFQEPNLEVGPVGPAPDAQSGTHPVTPAEDDDSFAGWVEREIGPRKPDGGA